MIRVILESPYSGDIERNCQYARQCLADSLKRDEAPLASHLLYTQSGVLDDSKPEERALGIEAGHAWTPIADRVVVYLDLGMSRGMLEGIAKAEAHNVTVEYRTLFK